MKQKGYLKVHGGHTIYWEQHGNATGQPVITLHGGPGGGMAKGILKYFDLRKWRVILFDQRGNGKSTPNAKHSMKDNTTWDLVEDINALREHFDIPKWVVCGGSWGSTLSLVYGQTYPENVIAFILRGIYLGTPEENEWLYNKNGAALMYPEEYTKFILPILPKIRGGAITTKKVLKTYYNLFHLKKYSNDKRRDAILAWNRWEYVLSFLGCAKPNKCPKNKDSFKVQESVALIENDYFINNLWLKPNEILRGMSKIKHIPCTIIQGRYDLVCPFFSAMKLKKVWKKAQLVITLAGHASSDPENTQALKKSIKSFEN
jgi:proline iminopeptidase